MHIDRYERPAPKNEPAPPSPDSVPSLPTPPENINDKISKLFRSKQNLQWETRAGFHSGPKNRRKGYKLAMWSLAASVIDGLILFAMGCVFMIVCLKIVKTSIPQEMWFDLALIFVGSAWMYMITTRFFLGCSIGEAACDLRLGRPQERLSSLYFLKVLIRSSLVTCTGLCLFPVLSLLTGKDLAGKLSGIQLFSLK